MFSRSSLLFAFTLVASCASAAVLRFGEATTTRSFSKRAPGEVITHCTVPGTVALTFDDGPYIWLNQISDALTSAGAKGTFFFNGANWACIYEESMAARVKYAYDNGHQVASHTWNHNHLATLDEAALRTQFSLTEDAIAKITGASVAYTRPPYGEYNQLVQDVAASRNQTLANWDFDSLDTTGATSEQSMQAYRDLIATHPESILTLNHEITQFTVENMPQIISELQTAGYQLVTLAECLGEEPYLSVGEPQARDATWTC